MKKIFAFLTLAIALVMASCSSSNGPEAVVKDCLKARQAHEWGKVVDLSKDGIGMNDEEKQGIIGMIAAFGASKEKIESFTIGEVTMVDDANAEVAVEIVFDEDGEKVTKNKKIEVEKIEGTWYVTNPLQEY